MPSSPWRQTSNRPRQVARRAMKVTVPCSICSAPESRAQLGAPNLVPIQETPSRATHHQNKGSGSQCPAPRKPRRPTREKVQRPSLRPKHRRRKRRQIPKASFDVSPAALLCQQKWQHEIAPSGLWQSPSQAAEVCNQHKLPAEPHAHARAAMECGHRVRLGWVA